MSEFEFSVHTDGQMTDEADEALLRRLQNVANYLRRTEAAVAEDMKAAIRYEQSSPEGRENMRADRTFGSLISRLEKRAARAIAENHPLTRPLNPRTGKRIVANRDNFFCPGYGSDTFEINHYEHWIVRSARRKTDATTPPVNQ
jgi:hypothetical protein